MKDGKGARGFEDEEGKGEEGKGKEEEGVYILAMLLRAYQQQRRRRTI